ncbi:RagB/SusD family nutrient uptake outer membrane protein [Sphingobacterium hungaricum]|uniref:RagB/SusD family nutrient uptake outer membrane protein n=1 Tax=Sphingobacterium hungaricum TaxID=2082723 RepID=A0A928YR60_9SPHI|nr:RagB/SusD family nutrient uptake outer membrane protein [Sphingobacterium hungaricum]MBE8713775.1 RagB/SusD family nutrient uptake outer membrane protein [Sphingobacterium hungaricum]
MKKLNILSFLTSICVLLIVSASCTNLDESIYSQIKSENFYKNKLEVNQAALRPFTHMQAWLAPTGNNGHYYHSELSSDQIAWPQKGRHGYDGGDHFRQHYHTWTSNESRMRGGWSLMWTGVGYVNNAIADISALNVEEIGMTEEERTEVVNQLKVLRAFHYLKIMDLWGNVPIATAVADPVNPETKSRAEVFDFVKTELEENVPTLPLTTSANIGQISQAAGYAMLAELYLNAEKWVGTAMWDECIAASDKIISGEAGGIGGAPSLSPDINSLYSNTNSANPESLFQFQFSRKAGFTFDWGGFYMGYDNIKDVLKVGYGGWNAFVVIPTAFDAYAENDLRKKDWFLFGPQYKFGTTTPVLGTEEYDGKPFVYVNSIRRESEGDLTSEGSMAEGEENSGARFNKYKSGTLDDANYQENDYIIYRLTEIYFNKAEAIMRKNGGSANAEAVTLINDSRKRSFSAADWPAAQYNTSTLTLDELLAERGREFIFEGKRRTDLIRFGKFTTAAWWDHVPTNDPNRELYAIPLNQLSINPNLKQNPGY